MSTNETEKLVNKINGEEILIKSNILIPRLIERNIDEKPTKKNIKLLNKKRIKSKFITITNN